MVRRLGAVQLDTISVLARSHELVAYARLGAIGRARVEQAYWGPKSDTFEYWSHAACVLPLEDWPAYAFKRRQRRAKGKRWHVLEERDKTCAEVLARVARRGTADRQRARRRQEGRPMVGLVRGQDRGRVVARHRRARVPRASRLRPRLRPGRARHSGRTPGRRDERRRVRAATRRCRRPLARRGDRSRPGGVPRCAASSWFAECWSHQG